jgi:hypothetical protein
MRMSDVTVLGVLVPTVVLGDIGMDVPHGEVVVIPAEKAEKSKDLWRAVSQRQLFRIMAGPHARGLPLPQEGAALVPSAGILVERARALEEENQALREALVRQEREFQSAQRQNDGKLDAILTMLSNGIPVVAGVTVPKGSEVSGEAPAFIPTSILPENSKVRIEPNRKEVDGSGLAAAGGKLRELRNKTGTQ